jgi:Flp pilus assembly protein TadD
MRFRILPSWTTALILIGIAPFVVHSEAQTLDLQTLAKRTRPAVLLLTVFDANGQQTGTGTGFLVSSDGRLITNHHVIEKGASASAKAENGAFFMVEGVLASDAENDLVVLKLQGTGLPYLTLASSASIQAGTRIAVIGCPLGLEGSVSEGIISAVRDSPVTGRILQITAAISHGSSGSPVVTADGKVIGVASAVVTDGQSINFAVPAESASVLLGKARMSGRPESLGNLRLPKRDPYWDDPDDDKAYTAAFIRGDGVTCLKLAQALVQRYPDSYKAHNSLAFAYRLLGFTEDEIAEFRQIIKIEPDNPHAWANLGLAYKRAGQTEQAISAYRQAVGILPRYNYVWSLLGFAYGEMGRIEEAIASFQQVVELLPDSADAWYNLGMTSALSGRHVQALVALRNLQRLDPERAEKLRSLLPPSYR